VIWGEYKMKMVEFIRNLFRGESERRRFKAIVEGKDRYYTHKDKFLCLSVEESFKEFCEGLY